MIARLAGWFKGLVGIAPKRLETRLTEAVALAIGEKALTDRYPDHPFEGLLRAWPLAEPDGKVLWHVDTFTIGSAAGATVADATGEVLHVYQRHSR